MSDSTKWGYLREMWGGLGLFLIIVLWSIIAFLNGARSNDLQTERIRACVNADDIGACLEKAR